MNYEEYENLKKGDVVYKLTDIGIIKLKVVNVDGYGVDLENSNKFTVSPRTVGGSRFYFLTEEQAEKELQKNIKNKEKKKKLFEYEKKLNEELGLETFLIKY